MIDRSIGLQLFDKGIVDLQTDELTAKKFLDFVYLDKLDASANEAPDLCCHLLKLAHQFEVLRARFMTGGGYRLLASANF